MATRQSFAHRLTEFAAAYFVSGKNCQKDEISSLSSGISNMAHGLLNKVVIINDLMGQEK